MAVMLTNSIITEKTRLINERGDIIFLNPQGQNFPLSYDEVIARGLDSNTYRAFHRVANPQFGPKELFLHFLSNKKTEILSTLKSIGSRAELNQYSNELYNGLRETLQTHIVEHQLNSYNKLRKPIDIIIEHLVSLEASFEKSREQIVPFLFLPLDSQMFQSCYLFDDDELYNLGLERTYTFKDIETEKHYTDIQNFVGEKAHKIELKNSIYFDLLWSRRYLRQGDNLLEVNP